MSEMVRRRFEGSVVSINYPTNSSLNEICATVATAVTEAVDKYWPECRVSPNADSHEATAAALKSGLYFVIFAENEESMDKFDKNSDDPSINDHIFVLHFSKDKLSLMTRNRELPIVKSVMEAVSEALNSMNGPTLASRLKAPSKKPEYLN